MFVPKSKKYFDDYTKFRSILLNYNIKNLNSFAKFMGLGIAAVSERFSGKRAWKLKELSYISKKFNITLDELASLLEIQD
jgi:predicted transcriptional regulator